MAILQRTNPQGLPPGRFSTTPRSRADLGIRVEPCPDPDTSEERLYLGIELGVHPDDPLAFAEWRVRAKMNEIPRHVLRLLNTVEAP